ncbi:hypothetical protein MPER_09676 [Moniliophthora perniciosa FA553]|nr:hypothetical protein MPER_09676 [Moniliophthora perniciosa FA553]
MSSNAAKDAAKDAATHYLQFDIQWSSISLLFYDYILTFPMEVKYVWGAKPRLSTALYVFCRYALVANVLYLLAVSKKLGDRVCYILQLDWVFVTDFTRLELLHCDTWYKVIGALSFFCRGAVIVTFTARTYAIFGCNKWILAYLSVLGLACMALDVTHIPGLRCVGSSSIHIGATMGSFRAAPGRNDVLSTIIEEFGDDPVAVASNSRELAMRQS